MRRIIFAPPPDWGDKHRPDGRRTASVIRGQGAPGRVHVVKGHVAVSLGAGQASSFMIQGLLVTCATHGLHCFSSASQTADFSSLQARAV